MHENKEVKKDGINRMKAVYVALLLLANMAIGVIAFYNFLTHLSPAPIVTKCSVCHS